VIKTGNNDIYKRNINLNNNKIEKQKQSIQ